MDASPRKTQPWVASSIRELLTGAVDRRHVDAEDARSGASFERLTIEGEPYFLKVLSYGGDWIMRVTGNVDHWEHKVWRAGLYQQVPECIDHAMVGMALDSEGEEPRLAMLMRDVGDALAPPGDEPFPVAQHEGFMKNMAAFHARFLGWRDDLGLCSMKSRLHFFAPNVIAPELLVDDVPGPVRVADEGWALLPERAPRLVRLTTALHAEPGPLVDALAATPSTFVSGDWKAGNLGSHADGRSVVLDWAYPGQAPPCWELVWYLALNRARLPESKEATIERYREGLEYHGVATSEWWERQLDLCLVGIMATFGWEKAVGDPEELAWWDERVDRAKRWLD